MGLQSTVLDTHVFLFGLSKIVGKRGGVVLVDLGGDFIEASDEGVLDPVHDELGTQN